MKKTSLYVLSLFYVMAGLNHFMNPDFYLKMMPSFLPAPAVLNVVSGAAEMCFGMLLMRPEARSLAAWGIILLLIAVFPANVYMYMRGGDVFGVPDWALLLRLPLQLALIAWAFWHTKNPEIDTETFETEIEIAVPPEVVWRELTDFNRYEEWNPFIRRANGAAREGERMEITIRPPGSEEFTFRNMILESEAPRSLVWKGSFIVRGLFDGTHYFRIENRDGISRFVQGEKFEGVLVRLLAGFLGSTKRGFAMMNEALKIRCEGRS